MISLAHPWILLLLPLPLLVAWLSPPHRQQVAALRFPFFHQITGTAGVEARKGSVIMRRSRLQIISAALVWLLLLLGLSRPELVGAPVEQQKAARDVVLAIDISGSMDERDLRQEDGSPQQRLASVKEVVSQFISGREGDRMALIVFGSKAYVQAPLTEDLGTINQMLEQTEVGMAGPHTAIGDSIGLAIRTFESSDIDQRLLILLSDGSDTNSRMSPANAAEIARDRGVSIFTIGVGDPDGSGENRVDLGALQDIARRTNGQYFYAEDEDALSSIYDEINTQAPSKFETLSYRPRTTLFHYPLLLAAVVGLASLAMLTLKRYRVRRVVA